MEENAIASVENSLGRSEDGAHGLADPTPGSRPGHI